MNVTLLVNSWKLSILRLAILLCSRGCVSAQLHTRDWGGH